MAALLSTAGFVATIAATFEDATALLKVSRFTFLLTAHRLGAHNGLHLVLRARAAGSAGAVVTTAVADPVLDAEAAALGAVTVSAPWDNATALFAALDRAKDVQPA
jgi:ActR/RegA family two-component response regulator